MFGIKVGESPMLHVSLAMLCFGAIILLIGMVAMFSVFQYQSAVMIIVGMILSLASFWALWSETH